MDDSALLAAFAGDKSDDAFRELVRRHVGMVYAVCHRQLRDAHWAEDVTQAVFILLARKAANLPADVIVGGWLYRAAVYACSNARRVQRTRSNHENLVTPMKKMTEEESVERAELEGLLDQGLMQLNKAQREVLVLRFFESKPLAEVARVRKQSLYMTQKTLDSAMARMRRFLSQRGVAATAALITVALVEQTARAAPVGLASSVGSAALGGSLSTYVTKLAAHLVRHAGRAKLMGSLAISGMVVVMGLAALGIEANLWGAGSPPASLPVGGAGMVAGGGLSPAQEAREKQALWTTLRQAEVALRGMDSAALANVVAFTNMRQVDNWNVMARVFTANQQLKLAASTKFGKDGPGISSLKTFGERLDEVLPRVDPNSVDWMIDIDQAALHFGYRDEATAGGTINFVKMDGQWKIDAARTVDVALEGLNGNQARVAVQDLEEAQQSAVLARMDALERIMKQVAQRIESEELYDLTQARIDLQSAETGSRAFFQLALRYDGLGQFRN